MGGHAWHRRLTALANREWATRIPVRATPGESRAGAAEWGPGWGQKEQGSSRRLSHSQGKERRRIRHEGWRMGVGSRGSPEGHSPPGGRAGSSSLAGTAGRAGAGRKVRHREHEVTTQTVAARQRRTPTQEVQRKRPHRLLIAALQPRGPHARALPHVRTPMAPPPGGGGGWSRAVPLARGHNCLREHAVRVRVSEVGSGYACVSTSIAFSAA